MEWTLKPGDLVDGWTLGESLGRGGNGEVWLAEHQTLGRAALKLLKLKFQGEAQKRYRRFRDEAAMHDQLSKRFPGVLPFVAHSLPENPTQLAPAWLATRVAIMARTALEGNFLREAVDAVASVADTLAALHAEGVSHRDIKPDNLFRYEDRWVVGDFGLVDYPDKDSVTDTGERLGPFHYLAPEMHIEANRSDGRKADVFSLGKTLWVLATEQRTPPPGALRADNPQTAIRAYRSNERAHQLDALVERATRLDPDGRPPMQEFAKELRAWLSTPQVHAQPDVTDTLVRIRDLAARVIPPGLDREKLKTDFQALSRKLRNLMPMIARRFAETNLLDGAIDSGPIPAHFYGRGHSRYKPLGAVSYAETSCKVFFPLPADAQKRGIELVAAVGARSYADGNVVLCCGYHVSLQWLTRPPVNETDWKRERKIGPQEWIVQLGSAMEDKAVAESFKFLNDNLGEALRQFAEIVDSVTLGAS